MRSVIVFFAILGVLLCPYNCTVRAVTARAMAEGRSDADSFGIVSLDDTAGCCDACRITTPFEGQPTPARDSESESGSCFCDGALFEASPSTQLERPWLSAMDASVTQLFALNLALQTTGVQPVVKDALTVDGRNLRIQMRSLLI